MSREKKNDDAGPKLTAKRNSGGFFSLKSTNFSFLPNLFYKGCRDSTCNERDEDKCIETIQGLINMMRCLVRWPPLANPACSRARRAGMLFNMRPGICDRKRWKKIFFFLQDLLSVKGGFTLFLFPDNTLNHLSAHYIPIFDVLVWCNLRLEVLVGGQAGFEIHE